jgi:hypothetical protein
LHSGLLAAIGIYGVVEFYGFAANDGDRNSHGDGAQRWQVVSVMLRESLVLMGAGILASFC